ANPQKHRQRANPRVTQTTPPRRPMESDRTRQRQQPPTKRKLPLDLHGSAHNGAPSRYSKIPQNMHTETKPKHTETIFRDRKTGRSRLLQLAVQRTARRAPQPPPR